jgi:hypothetical protein
MYKGKAYVSNYKEMKKIKLREMHNMTYVGHPGYQKSVAAVRSKYFWLNMKK